MAVVAGHAAPKTTSTSSGPSLRRDFGRVGLMFTSVGSVIGSGWLLGALNATKIAGPAAIISWVIGAAAIMLLAFIHAELGGMHAVNGGIVRFPHYAFGSLVGFGMGWVYWLGSVTLAPVETEAALQYADKYVNEGVGFHLVHEVSGQTVLTAAGTGLVYSGSSARVSYALGRNGYIPEAFDRLSERGVPWVSIIFSFVVGMIVFLPFPGWQKLVAFITSASVIIYAAQCLSLAAMRRQLPDHKRPFRLRWATVLAPLGFVVANLIVLFAGWSTDWKLFAAIGIGLVLLAVSQLSRSASDRIALDWRSSIWMWPWLGGLLVLSYLASFEGGRNDLHFGVDMVVTGVFSLAIYFFALACRLSPEDVEERIRQSSEEELAV